MNAGRTLLICTGSLLLAVCSIFDSLGQNTNPVATAPPPNIVLIVADDLGYSEIGAYGGEIRTPNIDSLAERGVKFTDFYTAPACSPTRAMLLSGVDNHKAGLGTAEEVVSGRIPLPAGFPPWVTELANLHRGQPGYEGHLNFRVNSFPALLHDIGYRTYMAGKWHLGLEPQQWPGARGFDRSFAMLEGGASHFGDGWRSVAPKAPAPYVEDQSRVEIPSDFYSTTVYTDKIINWLDDDLMAPDRKPFFVYLSYTAPHDPLHVPDTELDLYRAEYNDGYERIAEQRLARIKMLGLIDPDVTRPPRLPMIPAWNELPADVRADYARRMEIYAAMVEVMDREIGRFLTFLEDRQSLENTVVIFMSDNGAAPANLSFYGFAEDDFDNSAGNMGRPGSFTSYGPGWAQAGSVPFSYFKGSAGEGGIRAPLIIAGPGVSQTGIVNTFAHVTDLAPTILEYAGGKSSYDNGLIPMSGKSLLPVLSGTTDEVRDAEDYIGWEILGSRALRQDNWKIIFRAKPGSGAKSGSWALYDLARDPSETHDLSADQPDIFRRLLASWEEYVDENNVILLGATGSSR